MVGIKDSVTYDNDKFSSDPGYLEGFFTDSDDWIPLAISTVKNSGGQYYLNTDGGLIYAIVTQTRR